MENQSLLLQRHIMENTQSIHDYVKDLNDWEKEISKKENIIKNFKPQSNAETSIPEESKTNEIEIKQELKAQIPSKLKRDKNAMKDYYESWDKVDPEADLVEVDSTVVINKTINPGEVYINKKTSNAKANSNIKITNTRAYVNSTNEAFHLEKLKNEANANFAIGNYNKSLELYLSAINMIHSSGKTSYLPLLISLYNNKGNSQLKLSNFKQGIQDFDFVIANDKANMKAYYRRGLCHLNLSKFNLALDDFYSASKLASTSNDSEKKIINEYIEQTCTHINSLVSNEKNKMENFNYNETQEFRKLFIREFASSKVKWGDMENNVNVFEYFKLKNQNEQVQMNSSNSSGIGLSPPNEKERNRINYQYTNSASAVITNEYIAKFVYDTTKENLSSFSFKNAMKNFDKNTKEKDEFILKINPSYLPKIFQNDLDKEALLDILRCLRNILTENKKEQYGLIIEYLRNITKISRIKLVFRLIPKKDREILSEIFEILDKTELSSEIFVIKDYFYN